MRENSTINENTDNGGVNAQSEAAAEEVTADAQVSESDTVSEADEYDTSEKGADDGFFTGDGSDDGDDFTGENFDDGDDFTGENSDGGEDFTGGDFDSGASDIDDDDFSNDTRFDEIFDEYSGTDEKKLRKEAAKRRRQESIRNFLRKAKKPFFITLAALLLIFIAFFVYALNTIAPDRIMKNVYVEELDVGGMTYDEAVAAISTAYLFDNTEISVVNGENTFTINGADIGLSAIPEQTADKAMSYGKTGNFLQNGFDAMKLIFQSHVIVPAPQFDTALLDAKLGEFANTVLGERKQHYVELGDDGMATIYSGQTGYDGNPEAAREAVINAVSNEQFTNISVSFNSAPPDDMTLEAFDALVYKDPVDARYEINGNNVSVIPGDTGRYINKEEAAPLLQNVYEGCEPVKIPFYVSQPEKTSALLNAKLFETTLATYSTSYGTSTSNRCANIARAASLINGTVVAPGGVFSFNDTVGRRTAANGFYTATEYVDGKSVEGIGGGVCQVSSTLYSAVLCADMSIVERLNHMMTVGYVPLGQDATVSDGSVDFKFKNSSDYPVKISARTSGATITVSIIGGAWEPPRDVKIVNNTSTVGENTVVHSTRYVYSNGELVSTDTLNTSTYMPHKNQE